MRSGERYDVFDPEKVAVGDTRGCILLPPHDRLVMLSDNEVELVYEPRSGGRNERSPVC